MHGHRQIVSETVSAKAFIPRKNALFHHPQAMPALRIVQRTERYLRSTALIIPNNHNLRHDRGSVVG
jgi:hypothetical protein